MASTHADEAARRRVRGYHHRDDRSGSPDPSPTPSGELAYRNEPLRLTRRVPKNRANAPIAKSQLPNGPVYRELELGRWEFDD